MSKNNNTIKLIKGADMQIIRRSFAVFFIIFFVGNLYSQTSTQPTPRSGSTTPSFDGSTYTFTGYNGVVYKYSIGGDERIRGTLTNLTVEKDGVVFFPSYLGGVAANLNGVSLKPWVEPYENSKIRYTRVSHSLSGNEVFITWKMHNSDNAAEFCEYTYRFSITGQTLNIRIQGGTNYNKIEGLCFNQAFPSNPSTQTMRVINIPYLPIMNVLYNTNAQVFASMFTDWEITNSSGIMAFNGGVPSSSRYYSQRIDYEMKTNGFRNQLDETIYLSVANDVADVIPNVVGSPAPYRSSMWNKIVISYFKAFPYLLWQRDSETGTPFGYISDIYLHFGVRDAAFIIKNWGQGQFDDHYPCTWEPDPFTTPKGFGTPGLSFPNSGGITGLRQVIDTLKSRNYWFALHENYVDYYDANHTTHTAGISSHEYGKLPNNQNAKTFYYSDPNNNIYRQSYLLKPQTVNSTASTITTQIKDGLGTQYSPNFSYLDVSSGLNPSGELVTKDLYHSTESGSNWSYVDFSSDGKFRTTLNTYRNLASTVRGSYGIPVQGEGGWHFLYAGYFDDFEGRLQTGGSLEGYSSPLILEFSKKIRNLSCIHGVGHIQWFYGNNNYLDTNQVKRYMATELAYGHAALVTAAPGGVPILTDIVVSRLHAQWAQQYIRWVQQLYSAAEISSVTYWDASGEVGNASAYIKKYPNDFDNINSFNFMGRIKIIYSNNLEVWVNRTKWSWDYLTLGGRTGFYCYNIISGSGEKMGIGNSPANTVHLPAESGWFVYSPTWPTFYKVDQNIMQLNNETETPFEFALKQNYPNPFNPTTTINYSLEERGQVLLSVYNMLGQKVIDLVNSVKEAGTHRVTFDGSSLPSGVYVYRIQSNGFNDSKKLLLLK